MILSRTLPALPGKFEFSGPFSARKTGSTTGKAEAVA
jgi:hypothetical protein